MNLLGGYSSSDDESGNNHHKSGTTTTSCDSKDVTAPTSATQKNASILHASEQASESSCSSGHSNNTGHNLSSSNSNSSNNNSSSSSSSNSSNNHSTSSASHPEAETAKKGRARKVVLDYARLPISRPLISLPGVRETRKEPEPDAGEMEKAAAEAERLAAARRVLKEDEDKEGPQQAATESRNVNIAVHMQAICNSITCQSSVSRLLPQPKAIQPFEPGPEDGGDEAGDDVDVHFHRAGRPRDKPRADPSALAWVVQSARAPDVDEGLGILPDSLLKHPMMRERPDRADGPSPEELSQMRAEKREFVHIRADAMKDPNWQMSSLLAGQPGISHLSKLSEEASMYDAAQWESTAHANPTKYQKKKHQINWLAHEAMEKEAELLDRGAVQRMTKAQTQARYGW
ncbi:unnamed protein product [Polarella glacialis]|uniref:Uncharacterized protein n=1 Tax=Polarella glacialis TaxID=89957 RepID=A0A813I542_POLGL|nr:unnamed protein product [Polarella glacialis]